MVDSICLAQLEMRYMCWESEEVMPFPCPVIRLCVQVVAMRAKRGSINKMSDAEVKAWREGELAKVFSCCDSRGQGFLSPAEVVQMAQARRAGGKEMDERQQAALLHKFDTNGDAQVSCAEFTDYFMETWHGGMELMEEEEFERSVDELLAVKGERSARLKGKISVSVEEKASARAAARVGGSMEAGNGWTSEEAKVLARIQGGEEGVTEDQFVRFWLDVLPTDEQEFDAIVGKLLNVVRKVYKGGHGRDSNMPHEGWGR